MTTPNFVTFLTFVEPTGGTTLGILAGIGSFQAADVSDFQTPSVEVVHKN